jgi:ATP-dependent DNA ligase
MRVREPFHRPGWIYEEKVDGWRILAYKEGSRVRLVSRKGITHDGRFRELAEAVARLSPTTLVLDGEVAIFDQQLRSRFDLLRHRDPEVVATPPVMIAFDILHRDGEDLTALPLRDRRKLLEEAIEGADVVLPARRLAPDGCAAWAQVLERGYEGMVGKDDASRYRAGATRSWLKVKRPGWAEGRTFTKRVR